MLSSSMFMIQMTSKQNIEQPRLQFLSFCSDLSIFQLGKLHYSQHKPFLMPCQYSFNHLLKLTGQTPVETLSAYIMISPIYLHKNTHLSVVHIVLQKGLLCKQNSVINSRLQSSTFVSGNLLMFFFLHHETSAFLNQENFISTFELLSNGMRQRLVE